MATVDRLMSFLDLRTASGASNKAASVGSVILFHSSSITTRKPTLKTRCHE